MKIPYKKRYQNTNLILAVLWLGFFTIGIFIKDDPNWMDYGWLLISFMYFGLYHYQKQKPYLSIENGILKRNSGFGKQINLNEIKHIKSFAGDYILQSDETKLKIDTQLIDSNSLENLNVELKRLNVNWV